MGIAKSSQILKEMKDDKLPAMPYPTRGHRVRTFLGFFNKLSFELFQGNLSYDSKSLFERPLA